MKHEEAKSIVENAPNWHQRFEIYPGIITPGSYDPTFLYELLNLPQSLHGKRVLDIGPSDGFYSMKMAQAGADVVCVDYRAKNAQGFSAMERISGLRFNYIESNIFDLSPEMIGKFDIILFLGVLYHLPDMLRAVDIVHSLASDVVYLETHCDSKFCPDYSAARYYVSNTLNNDYTNFWSPNPQCLRDILIDCCFFPIREEVWGDRILVESKVNMSHNQIQKLKYAYSKIQNVKIAENDVANQSKITDRNINLLIRQCLGFYNKWRKKSFPATKHDVAWRHEHIDARVSQLELMLEALCKKSVSPIDCELQLFKSISGDQLVEQSNNLLTWISFVDDTRIEGLVLDINNPNNPQLISIYLNNFLFNTLLACELVDYRKLKVFGEQAYKELVARLGGTQIVAAGFSYVIPDYAFSKQPVSVTIKNTANSNILYQETKNFEERFRVRENQLFHDHLIGRLKAKGFEGGRLQFEAAINSLNFDVKLIVCSQLIGDVGANSSLFPDESRLLKIIFQGDICPNDHEDQLYLMDLSGGTNVLPSLSLYVPKNCEFEFMSWRIPSEQQMRRVMGFADGLSYYFDGFAGFKMLDNALLEFTGRSITDFDSILDWGCGCGRISQHLLKRTNSKIFGLDIDTQNIAWCTDNLESGTFIVTDLMPPVQFESESFDLVFGISVFTHLTEEAQDAWLKEIKRVMKPGGVALFTILSEHSLYANTSWDIPPSLLREFHSRGISDATIGNTLDTVVGNENFEYYRETWHSHEYVYKKWGSVMRVIGIIRAAHLNYQDLVILRNDLA